MTDLDFFPKGVSSEGHEDEMYLPLGNYAGNQVVDLEDGPDIVPFSAEQYKDLTGFQGSKLTVTR